jgi:hypothetical protein
MAFIAPALPYIAAAATAVSAYGEYEKGQDAKDQSRKQAQIYEEQAAQERNASRQEASDYEKRARAMIASRRAILGGSGVQSQSGSALLGTEEMITESERQAARIRAGGNLVAGRIEQQAGLTRMSGSAKARSATYGAGASLLQGGAQAYGYWGG